MRVLVTGASGFLGAHLCRRLAAMGSVPRALVRKTADVAALKGLLSSGGVELAQGDVTDFESLAKAVKDVDIVFHLAGLRRAPTREPFHEVNAEGTRRVCDAMVGEGRRMRLVLAGSLSASGPSTPERPRREEDPFAPQEWYGESKVEAEKIAHAYRERLEVTTIRPCRILGPGDHENLAFFKVVKKGLKLHVTGGPRPLSMVDVQDVVDQMLLQAEKKEAVGEAFFCAANETLTLEQMQEILARELRIEPRTLRLAPFALTALANAADVVSRATGKHLPLNRKLAKQLLVPAWTCSTEKAQRLLGFKAKVRLADSIRESLRWYQAHGWL